MSLSDAAFIIREKMDVKALLVTYAVSEDCDPVNLTPKQEIWFDKHGGPPRGISFVHPEKKTAIPWLMYDILEGEGETYIIPYHNIIGEDFEEEAAALCRHFDTTLFYLWKEVEDEMKGLIIFRQGIEVKRIEIFPSHGGLFKSDSPEALREIMEKEKLTYDWNFDPSKISRIFFIKQDVEYGLESFIEQINQSQRKENFKNYIGCVIGILIVLFIFRACVR